MNTRSIAALLLLVPAIALAQAPVDDNGNVVGQYESQADIMPIGDDGIVRLSQFELQELVGPIALYPDDLLAIVLPASAYPLQIVEAARFLEALETDATLQPDEDWDDSIVALINYPEIIALLNEDLDWTLRLGEAVVAQQADVVAAVEAFRDLAYAAGNLKSDSYQTVSNDDGVINISPATEDVIYVPYYEPASVVYYQPRPVYYYYPTAYPLYYYPYASDYRFNNGFFWGVTTAFTIGWMSDSLYVYHPSYYGHPYYGHSYWNHWYCRSPSISVYNTTYANNYHNDDHYSHGDRWHAQETRRAYVQREGYSRDERRSESRHIESTGSVSRNEQRNVNSSRQIEPMSFRERDTRGQAAAARSDSANSRSTVQRSRDVQRQVATVQPRDTRRQETVATAHDTRQQAPTRTETRQRAPTRTETRQQAPTRTETRQQAPTRNESRQQVTARTESRQQAPIRTESRQQVATRTETRQQAPIHTATRQQQQAPMQTERAPAPQSHRAAESQARPQPSSSSQPRSQERSSSGSNAESRSRSRSRDR